MDTTRIKELSSKVLKGAGLSFAEANEFLSLNKEQLPGLLSASDKIRQHFRGNKVSLCSITSAKTGACPEDCAFCSQSSHHNTDIATHPLISLSQILEKAEVAFKEMADRLDR